MSVRIIESRDGKMAAMYDSGSNWAFGPVFRGADRANAFIKWVAIDPRLLTEAALEKLYMEWLETQEGE